MKNHLSTFLIFCILSGIAFGCKNTAGGLRIGDTVKDFRLMNLNHERFYLNQHKGKTVVLIFWATWCKICKEEMMFLSSLSALYDSDELLLAAVCTDPENMDDVKEVQTRFGITLPILLDQKSTVANRYQVTEWPTTIIIDSSQRISYIKQGYSPLIGRQIKTQIQNLLASEISSE